MNATAAGEPRSTRASEVRRWPLAILLLVALGLLVLAVYGLFAPENPCGGFPPVAGLLPVFAAPIYLYTAGVLLASKRWQRGLLMASWVGWGMLLVGILLIGGWGGERPGTLFLAIPFLAVQLALGLLAETSITKLRRAGIRVNRQEGAGAAVGYFLGSALVLTVASAHPLLRTTRLPGNESSAVGSVRTIITAQETYATTYPDIGYAEALMAFQPPSAGELSNPQNADLMDPYLASGKKSGYQFRLLPRSRDEAGRVTGYVVLARPLRYRRTGCLSLYGDETAMIRRTFEDRWATVNDPPKK